jgi:hypothetical protein
MATTYAFILYFIIYSFYYITNQLNHYKFISKHSRNNYANHPKLVVDFEKI